MVGWGKLRFSILSLIILVGVLGFMSAATLNVGTGQTYTTIQSAITAARDGDTIEVMSGTYNEKLDVPTTKNDLIIKAVDGTRPIISNNAGPLIWVHANRITLMGFEFIGTNNQVGIRLEGQNLHIENNIIHDVLTGIQTNTMFVQGNNQILNNNISNAQVGISLQNDYNIVKNNIINVYEEGFGIASFNSTFENNKITVGTNGYKVKVSSEVSAITNGCTNNCIVYQGSIQDGINAANDGDTIYISAGIYNERLDLKNKELTIIGAGSDLTIIDSHLFTGYAIQNFGDNSVLRNLKLIGTSSGSSSYGFKISGTNGITLENIIVENSYKTGIDLNGVNNAVLTNIEIKNTIWGFGLMIGDSNNVIVTDVTTSGNAWGGVSIQTSGKYYAGGSNNVQFLGNFNVAENLPLLLENDPDTNPVGTYYDITNTQLPAKFNYVVYDFRTGDNYKQKYYFETLESAKLFAQNIIGSTNPVYSNITIYDKTENNYYVLNGMKIQDGINAANSGDVVYVSAGEYVENIFIIKPITLLGAQANVHYVNGGRGAESKISPNKLTYAIVVSSADTVDGIDGVTINGFEITVPKGMQAIHSGNNGPSNLNIQFNYIHDIGTEYAATSGVHGINYRMGSANESNVNISDNYIVNVTKYPNSINGGGSAGIWIGQSNANGTLSNLVIERNFIKNIKTNVSHKEFESSPYEDVAKYTASGIYIGVAWKSNVYTGKVNAPIIQDNIITEVEGGTAYGIELTGNTPYAEIKNNTISKVNSPSPSYAFGIGVTSTNKEVSTIIITKNKITNVLTAIANGNINFLDAKNNYWGTNPNFGNLISGKVSYAPWFSDSEMTLSTIGQVIEKDTTTNVTTSKISEEINLTTENVVVTLPKDLVISSTNTSWNGTILPPTIRENATVEPNTEGLTETVSKVIEVGFEGVKLILDKAVKIVIPGEGGTDKKVGYSYDGTFYKITTECVSATDYSNIVGNGECYYDDGIDMIIWTKHFTQFVTYNSTDNETAILNANWTSPRFPLPLQAITIFTNFTDPSGIASALIRYNYVYVAGDKAGQNEDIGNIYTEMEDTGDNIIWSDTLTYAPTQSNDGYFRIRFNVTDGSGNSKLYPNSTEWEMYVSVDGTPANTNLSLNGSNSGNYITSNTQIKLNATDIDWDGAGNYQPSGVNYSKYKINNGYWNLSGSYTNFLIDSTHSDGNYTISYYSVDNATNNETEKSTILTLDNTKPLISIISPENKTYDSTINQLNYSASDSGSGLNSCWYNNGTLNSTLNNCLSNFTEFSSNEGLNTWTLYANDSVGNLNSTKVYFTQDKITPQISYNANTPENNSYLNVNSVLVNVSIIENNTNSVILNWNGINESITNNLNGNYWITKPNLSDGIYSFNVFVNDSVGHSNATETRIITVDRTKPLISYTTGTANNNANLSQDYIYVNTTFSDTNFANIIFRLYNSTSLVNSTNYTTQIKEIIWTSLPEGRYNYNTSVYDLAGNFNSTETRSLTLDRTAPTLEIVYPNSSVDNMAYLTVKANSTDSLSGINNVKLTLKNSAGHAVLGINNSLMIKGTSGYEYTLYAGNLSADNYTMEVNSLDKAGNLNTTNRTFELKENVVPTLVTTINGNVPVATGGNVSFTFNINVRGNGTIKFGMDDIAGLTPTFLNATISSGNNTAKVGESDFTGAQTLTLTDTDLNATNVQGTFTLSLSLPSSMTPGNYPINYYIDVA